MSSNGREVLIDSSRTQGVYVWTDPIPSRARPNCHQSAQQTRASKATSRTAKVVLASSVTVSRTDLPSGPMLTISGKRKINTSPQSEEGPPFVAGRTHCFQRLSRPRLQFASNRDSQSPLRGVLNQFTRVLIGVAEDLADHGCLPIEERARELFRLHASVRRPVYCVRQPMRSGAGGRNIGIHKDGVGVEGCGMTSAVTRSTSMNGTSLCLGSSKSLFRASESVSLMARQWMSSPTKRSPPPSQPSAGFREYRRPSPRSGVFRSGVSQPTAGVG